MCVYVCVFVHVLVCVCVCVNTCAFICVCIVHVYICVFIVCDVCVLFWCGVVWCGVVCVCTTGQGPETEDLPARSLQWLESERVLHSVRSLTQPPGLPHTEEELVQVGLHFST